MQTLVSEWDREPLTVADLVPTVALRYHFARVHVGTSDREVLRETREAVRCARASDPRWTREVVKQTYAAALWLHRENRAEYGAVMGGGWR